MKSAETRGKAEKLSFPSASTRLLLGLSSTFKMDPFEILGVKSSEDHAPQAWSLARASSP
jgi:hypothetical protein